MMNRREFVKKSSLVGLLPFGLLPGCGGGGDDPPQAAPTPNSQWQQNLDEIVNTIKTRHILPWRNLSESVFDAQAASLRQKLPDLTDSKAATGLMALVASLADGHTALGAWPWHRYFPLRFTSFSDGIFVTTVNGNDRLLRAQLMTVGGVPAETILRKCSAVWPTENEFGTLLWGQFFLSSGAAIHHAGLSDSALSAVFEFKPHNATATEKIALEASLASAIPERPPIASAPRYVIRQNEDYWFEPIPEKEAMYLRYYRCREANKFGALMESMGVQLRAKPVRRLVIDLRGNEGGDSAVFAPFAQGLSTPEARALIGSVAFITDRGTFSAAMDASLDLKTVNARHVGEPSSQRPNFLGNATVYETSRAGLRLQYPTKLATRVPDYPSVLEPDLRVAPSSSDYFDGRDPALDAALA